MTVRIVDDAQYENRLRQWDFDMIVATWGQSLSPGNEQRGYWGSQAADQPGSRNLIGIKNPAVDALIDRIIFAKNRAELVAATKALDRVLLWNFYVVPQWTYGKMRTARWDRFGRPDPLPKYGVSGFPDHLVVGRGQGGQGGIALVRQLFAPRRSHRRRWRHCFGCASDAGAAATAGAAAERHGMSAFGDLKYPADFPHFDYVDPKAPKGGVFSQIGPNRCSTRTRSPSIRSTATSSRAMPAQGMELTFASADGAGQRRAGRHVWAGRPRGAHLRRRSGPIASRLRPKAPLPRRQHDHRARRGVLADRS